MKRIIFIFCFLYVINCYAQTKAVTENGDEVILFENKTWDYSDKNTREEKEIKTNNETFNKSKDATFFLKSKNLPEVGIHLNTKKWTFEKSKSEKPSEYEFELKDKDAYAMIITERIEVPLDALKSIALENAKAIAPDMKIIFEEYRMVNDKKIFCMQMNGTVKGIKVAYLGYYYSYENGTLQFLSYTSQSLFKEYKDEIETLLNGLEISK
jgi:hypothetical protein